MAKVAMNLAELTKLALPTLSTLPEGERAEAVRWLREHVASTTSVDVQQILFETWLSIWNRPHFDRTFSQEGR